MFGTRGPRAIGAVVLGLAMLLAACGQPAAPSDPSVVNFNISLARKDAGAQTVEAQGSPFDPVSGATSIETVSITVRDSDGKVVNFTYSGGVYTADSNGTETQVTLDTSGRMLLGTDIGAAMVTLESLRADVIGLNC